MAWYFRCGKLSNYGSTFYRFVQMFFLIILSRDCVYMWLVLIFFLLKSTYINALSSFTIIKMLFNSSSFCVIRVWLSVYSRLLIFLLAILIPTGDSSSLAFHMMHSAYKLNKKGDNIQPWRTPFPILNQSVVLIPYTGFSGDR